MNILILSDFNIGGQPTALAKAINEYTNHRARCIIVHPDHFNYDRDILVDQDGFKEATKLVNEWADFYHFGSYVFNWPGADFNKILNRNNCCIKYYGSYLRDRGEEIRRYHEQTGLFAITGNDYTITHNLPNSFYHLNSYFTMYGDCRRNEIPYCDEYKGDILKICCGSAGHPMKGYPILQQTVKELQDEGIKVELDIISGLSNKECLERKLKSHVTFTSLGGGWGISGIESMFIGHVVLSCLDPFVLSMYPDQPAVLINKENLKDAIKELTWYPKLWATKSWQSRDFAMREFSSRKIIARYMYIIDLIRNEQKYKTGYHLPEEIYAID